MTTEQVRTEDYGFTSTDAADFRAPSAPSTPGLDARVVQLWRVARAAGSVYLARGLVVVRFVAPAIFMSVLLFIGFSQQVRPPVLGGTWGDVYRYQCFAVLFWSGPHGLNDLPSTQCTAVLNTLIYNVQTLPQSHAIPSALMHWMLDHSALDTRFHTLPLEYPIVSMIPFSLPLLAPPARYVLVFGLEMLLFAVGLYAVLIRVSGYRAAVAFALFMGLGAFATGAARFDLVPAGLTLAALVLAERRHWTLAYVLLALATFSKFYPVLLVIPLAAVQLRDLSAGVRWWQRLRGLGWFIGICTALLVASIAINPIGMYRQISVFGHRPIEVESVPATLLWIGTWVHIPMQSFIWFGSDNVSSPLSQPVMALMDVALAGGLVLIARALWHRRFSLAQSWLAVLLLTVATGKIFSAQYLMWVFPIAIYTLDLTELTVLLWLAACALTTFSFPFEWRAPGGWHATIALRNVLIVIITTTALQPCFRRQVALVQSTQGSKREVALAHEHIPGDSPTEPGTEPCSMRISTLAPQIAQPNGADGDAT